MCCVPGILENVADYECGAHRIPRQCGVFRLLGASQREAIVRRAAELGYDFRAGFYGTARAHHEAMRRGVCAFVGCILDLPDGTRFPVIGATRNGYRTLNRHLTDLHLSPGKPARAFGTGGDMIALTGDRDGPVCRPLLMEKKQAALEAAERLIAMFGRENDYIEITPHGLRDDRRLNKYRIDLARHLGLPLIASNAPLHATHSSFRKRFSLQQNISH